MPSAKSLPRLANRLSHVVDFLVIREQMGFIKGRQILDGPLIVNEILDWYKKKKKILMFFKVDFEKHFDLVSWDFLERVMLFLGFGYKWIRWIHGCLNSATTSVLVNGSPFVEFVLERGLR